ncbi:hypothetical protein U1Q18_048135 [Sarracenia purpurea var. burkii]
MPRVRPPRKNYVGNLSLLLLIKAFEEVKPKPVSAEQGTLSVVPENGKVEENQGVTVSSGSSVVNSQVAGDQFGGEPSGDEVDKTKSECEAVGSNEIENSEEHFDKEEHSDVCVTVKT